MWAGLCDTPSNIYWTSMLVSVFIDPIRFDRLLPTWNIWIATGNRDYIIDVIRSDRQILIGGFTDIRGMVKSMI